MVNTGFSEVIGSWKIMLISLPLIRDISLSGILAMSTTSSCYINDILSGRFESKPALAVTVVYSGGDDVFLLGAWNDVVEAAHSLAVVSGHATVVENHERVLLVV